MGKINGMDWQNCKTGEYIMIDLPTKRIYTKRLIIKPIEASDVDAIHEYASDLDITMMLYLPNETIDVTRGFVDYVVTEWSKEEPGCMEYVVLLENKVIGGVGVEFTADRSVCETGWILHKDYRNNGFTTEAAKALIEYAFGELSVQKVIAHCDSRNISSERVMQKIGMKRMDDTGTRYYPKTGVTSGEYLYAIERG